MTLLSFSTAGQKISTRELENIADKFGVDSALKAVRPISEIFTIDTSVALSIAYKCSDLKNYTRQFPYFTNMGQVMKSQFFNLKALDNLKTYKTLLLDPGIKQYKAFVIPDQIFLVLAFQNDTSIIPALKAEYNFWEHNADSIKNTYPSKTKRFFQRFKGTPPSEQLFSDCKENSYKLAWTLHQLGDSDFSMERANTIRQQLVPYLRDYNMERFKFKTYQLKPDTLKLNKSYTSIDEIDFDNEIEFIKLKENLEGDKCWKQIITNNKTGLYEIGCQWAPLAGRGKTIRLELIEGNKLQVSIISAWIS
ncbi:MAG: hypothetical protein JSU03_05400 [Bacteroidetes bacterium]|nr:hypothetical protein [Bacteroidota bacterium]